MTWTANDDWMTLPEPGEQSAYQAYTKNIAIPTPMICEQIAEWSRKWPDRVIVFAIREAAKYGRRNSQYIAAILRRYETEGVPPPARAKSEERNDRPTGAQLGRYLEAATRRRVWQFHNAMSETGRQNHLRHLRKLLNSDDFGQRHYAEKELHALGAPLS